MSLPQLDLSVLCSCWDTHNISFADWPTGWLFSGSQKVLIDPRRTVAHTPIRRWPSVERARLISFDYCTESIQQAHCALRHLILNVSNFLFVRFIQGLDPLGDVFLVLLLCVWMITGELRSIRLLDMICGAAEHNHYVFQRAYHDRWLLGMIL